MRWRVTIWDSDGVSNERNYTQDSGGPGGGVASGIASFDSIELDPSGSCIAMRFTALPALFDGRVRDVIRFQTAPATGSLVYTSRFLGYITTAGTEFRSESVQAYEALGLKNRYYEKAIPDPAFVPAALDASIDVATHFSTLANAPAASVAEVVSVDAPITTFVLGPRGYGWRTYGEVFDELASLVGSFVVPTGETYFYDGIYYNDGDTVPKVAWGVDAGGELFFRRPPVVNEIYTEGLGGVEVDWLPSNSENYASRVVLLFASGLTSEDVTAVVGVNGGVVNTLPVARALAFSQPTYSIVNGDEADRVIRLENPNDLCEDLTVTVAANARWDNLSNIVDGDPTTYGNLNATWFPAAPRPFGSKINQTGSNTIVLTADIPLILPTDQNRRGGFWVIRYASDDPVPVIVTDASGDSTLTYELRGTNTDAAIVPREVVIVAKSQYTAPQSYMEILRIEGTTNTRVYEVRYRAIDAALAQQYAEAFAVPANVDVATITIHAIEPILTNVDVQPAGTSISLPLAVEKVEYVITVNEGALTRYFIGQKYNADAAAEAVVLESFVRRISGAVQQA